MAVTINGTTGVDTGTGALIAANSTSAGYVRLYEDTDNGSNYIDIIAPASVTSNRTLTLPDVTGTLLTTATTGTVLQVVQGTYSTEVSSSSSTYADTGLSASITPSSASSKILVLVSHGTINKTATNGSNRMSIRLVRGSTTLTTPANGVLYTATAINNRMGWSYNYLDSPSTTSSTTYKTQFISNDATSSVDVQTNNSPSTITLMEIAG
jgi:hypothetical protein